MKVTKIIESKHWINKKTGQTASIYGSVPYVNERDKKDWAIESRGFTWRLDNGTVGLGRQPVKTMSEAIEVMNKVNNVVMSEDEYRSWTKKLVRGE